MKEISEHGKGRQVSNYLSASNEDKAKTESDASVKNRVFASLNELSDRYQEGNILIITHGGILRLLLKELLPLDCDLQAIHTTNGAFFKMTAANYRWRIEEYQGIFQKE